MAEMLNAGAKFPQLTLQFTDGGSSTLPADLEQPWTVVLFYRGHW